MTKCAFCNRVPSKVHHAKGVVLRSIKRTKPRTTEDTPICSLCYNKAVDQYNKYREKIIRRKMQEKPSLSTVASFSAYSSQSSSTSSDAIDHIVNQRSLLSVRRENRRAEAAQLVSPRRLQFPQSRGRQETGSNMGPPDEPIQRRVQTDSESIENPLNSEPSSSLSHSQERMVVVQEYEREQLEVQRGGVQTDSESIENPLNSRASSSLSHSQERMVVVQEYDREQLEVQRVAEVQSDSESLENPLEPTDSFTSQPPGRRFVVREYESDEEVEIHREGDHLPGVQPYIRRRRTQVIFTDERLLPVYINKSYGG